MKEQTRYILRTSEQAVAIVLGLDSATALGVIRSLGKRGIPVIGIGGRPQTLGGCSRYCAAVETASTESAQLALLAEISHLASRQPVVFPESDDLLLLLDRHQAELNGLHWLPKAERPLSELTNKRAMIALAQRLRLEVPRTFFSDEHPLEIMLSSLSYPCFIKPLLTQSQFKTKGEIADSPEELASLVRQSRFADGYLCQEIIPGPVSNLFFCLSYSGEGGKPLSVVTGHKLRQLPPDFGIGTLAVTRRHNEVAHLSELFLGKINFHGLADLEFKLDPRDNRFKFIEINPRACGLIELARCAGQDMAFMAYQEQTTGQTPLSPPPAPDGLLWMSMLDDLISGMKYEQEGFSLGGWLKSVRKKNCDAVFASDDPRPFVFSITSRIGKQWRKRFHRGESCP